MAGENVANVTDGVKDSGADGDGRQRSTIAFPYNHLNDAIEVAQAIHSNVGSGECDDTQLSAWMKLSPKSSGFRVKLSASRLFGLIETGTGGHKLSPLGRMIVDPQREREARAKAFMKVPLYSALYENHKGGVLPPAAALERDMVGLGVAEKQKERARQVFERSADQAGFFEHGKTRLVMPGIATREEGHGIKGGEIELEIPDDNKIKNGGGGNGGGDHSHLHPFIQGLLKTLPDPEKEKDWPLAQRLKWLQTAANIFDLIYEGEGGIEVRAATAHRSPRPSD